MALGNVGGELDGLPRAPLSAGVSVAPHGMLTPPGDAVARFGGWTWKEGWSHGIGSRGPSGSYPSKVAHPQPGAGAPLTCSKAPRRTFHPPPAITPSPPNLLHCAVLSCLMEDAGAGVLAVFFVVEGSRGSPGRTWRERRPTPQFPRGSPDPQGVRRESTSGLAAAAWYLNRHPPT